MIKKATPENIQEEINNLLQYEIDEKKYHESSLVADLHYLKNKAEYIGTFAYFAEGKLYRKLLSLYDLMQSEAFQEIDQVEWNEYIAENPKGDE